ncbi:IS701 family transposase [Gemmata sp. G18]|uniref:IS701 family transposase n=1 Tax=Gemmata palustris TaxID=2822762 RepID=A0ABS5BVV4_9BACT|nr:IS701 family transposase [Gemmata palustris]MBP3957862.1 IS701 family transposase [Gemmata palustris]
MTEQEIVALGPAFAAYLRRFRGHFGQERTAEHFNAYCRGLLSDLPRKSVEPIALAAGTAVRTLQAFLATARWDHGAARDNLQKHIGAVIADLPTEPMGTVGVIDETSCRKWGDHTPGVQRQYLGCVGKVDNGIVTVHIGVTKGTFQALLDADLFVPESWDADRDRCEQAGIPDDVGHQTKWRLAVDQWLRATGNGVAFDWLTFDEGYGAAVPFLRFLSLVNQQFVAEVPVSFAVRDKAGDPARRADARLTEALARNGKRHRIAHRTVRASFWRAVTASVWVADREHTLVATINEATGETKYFLTNATTASVARVLAVAFRRWTVEHGFRLGKQEAGLLDYEGRDYTGLVRHLTLALLVLGFVATCTERLRGEKPRGYGGTGVPGAEPAVRGHVPSAAGRARRTTHQQRHLLPPDAQRPSRQVPQEAAA